jgi:hypothetical protein
MTHQKGKIKRDAGIKPCVDEKVMMSSGKQHPELREDRRC